MLADDRSMSASALDRWTRPTPTDAPPPASISMIPLPRASLGPERPLVITCGPMRSEAARLLAGRPIDVIATPNPAQAARLAERMEPVACFISGALDGGDPALLVAHVARLPSSPTCIVVLDDQTWMHAEACRRAGARDVVHVDDWRSLTRSLRGQLPELFTRDARAEAVLPLMVSIGDTTYAAESLDLRETGIAIRDFPVVPVGRRVRLRLAVDETDVWLSGEVARIFERKGLRVVAVRFVDIEPDVQAWLVRIIAQLDKDGPEALEMGAWRADVRSVLNSTFATPSVPALPPGQRLSLVPRLSGAVEAERPRGLMARVRRLLGRGT